MVMSVEVIVGNDRPSVVSGRSCSSTCVTCFRLEPLKDEANNIPVPFFSYVAVKSMKGHKRNNESM